MNTLDNYLYFDIVPRIRLESAVLYCSHQITFLSVMDDDDQ